MFNQYFKTGLRSLWRNKSFAFINIAGLAAGIAVCLIIFLIAQFELSFDDFHKNKDHIFRMISERRNADGVRLSQGVPEPVSKAFHNDFSSITSTAVYAERGSQILISDNAVQSNKKFKEDYGVFYADPSFFKIFDYPLIAGEFNSLKDPNTAVITKEIAEKYFGDWQAAIGKTYKLNNKDVFRITGVLANLPKNTDFPVKILNSYSTLKEFAASDDWISIMTNHEFYFLLPENLKSENFVSQLKNFERKYLKDDAKKVSFAIQPLSAVHFDPDTGNFLNRTVSLSFINTLWLIAGFILLIACINFINLSTAQSFNRAKEVAVRKVLGGSKLQLRFQFYIETALITIFAVMLAVIAALIFLPYINTILSLELTLSFINNPFLILLLLCLSVVIVFLAGGYPSFVLSNFNPVEALKSKVRIKTNKGITLRRSLVVFQFAVAQALIIGTFITVKQMDFFRNYPLGFDKEAIVNIAVPDDSIARLRLDYLKNKLLDINGVKNISFSFSSPADETNWSSNFHFNNAEKETDWNTNLKFADNEYLKTYGIKLIAGRNLNSSDTVKEFLVNESLLKRVGINNPQDAINKHINLWGQMDYPIVGVIRDFNAMPLRKALSPVLIASMKEVYSLAGIRLETKDMNGTLAKVQALWNDVYPDFVYEQKFLDQKIEGFYLKEKKLSQLYTIFAGLSVFLSCLGLYGLVSFMAAQRIKEFGIRKVLGATVNNIIVLFSGEFMMLIGIAFLIAAPITWYFMNAWLEDFSYRINISWWMLLLSGLLSVIIAMLTISFQAIKAAFANPVKSLRTE